MPLQCFKLPESDYWSGLAKERTPGKISRFYVLALTAEDRQSPLAGCHHKDTETQRSGSSIVSIHLRLSCQTFVSRCLCGDIPLQSGTICMKTVSPNQ